MNKQSQFIAHLSQWYALNKRTLPFRGQADPYKIWVSEILLQQTQMSRGVEFYKRFVKKFPTVRSLSKSTWEEFLPYFEGLGYYNRGRNMLKAAEVIVRDFKGKFPKTETELRKIPGIGPYTAKAILSFAFNQPVLPLDTNIKRILGRVFLGKNGLDDKDPNSVKIIKKLCRNGQKTVPPGDLAQGMMDFGSSICLMKRPKCLECPLFKTCIYGQKVKPYLQKKVRATRMKYTRKYVEAEIYEHKNLLKYCGKLLGGYLKKGDERAFLKLLALQKMGLQISVRPAYRTWIKNSVKYSAHRCYVLMRTLP